MTTPTIYQKINNIIQAVEYQDNPYDAVRDLLIKYELTIIPSAGAFTIKDADMTITCAWDTQGDFIRAHHEFLTALFMITPTKPQITVEDTPVEPDPRPEVTPIPVRPLPAPVFTKIEKTDILKGSDIKFIHTIKNIFSTPALAKGTQHAGIITIDNKDIMIPLTADNLREIETACGYAPYNLDEIKPSNEPTERIRVFSAPVAITTKFDDEKRKGAMNKVVTDFRNPAVLASFNELYADTQPLLITEALGCAVIDYTGTLQDAIQTVENYKKSLKAS